MSPHKIAHKVTPDVPQAEVEPVKKDKSPAEKGMLGKVIGFFSNRLSKLPAERWNNKGVSLNDLGKPEGAIECFDKALEINPRVFEPWNNKGLALKNLGRYEEAIECFNRALEIDHRQAKVWSNKGRALYSLSRFDESIRCYDKALETNPGFAGVWNNKGISLLKLCRFAEAIECFDKALEIDPTFEPAKRGRVFCVSEANEPTKRENPPKMQNTTSGRWQIGDKIENRYEVHDIKGGVGKSGFGIVYICYDHRDKVPVAIKTFQERFLSSQKARDDFTNETLTWIKLDKHKNIVKAHFVINIEGRPYIFLEYVAGGNLDEWLYTKQLDLPLALNFAIQFCNGMDYAYKKLGLIHLDIKPGNILLTTDKTVKITDFGLAKSIEAKPEQIEVPSDLSYIPSSVVGTPLYMAPEQFTDREIDTRADIYAFGIVLYQMVANSYPYPRKNSWLVMHLKESPLPIKQDIPPELNMLISKCLEKEASKRYNNFSELKQELSKIYFDLTGERIIEETPEELETWELVNKGSALDALGRNQEAVACHDKALEINPRDDMAWNNKGNALSNLGRHQEAIVCYNKALEANPRYAEAWSNKGSALDVLGRNQEAITCFDKALEINPRLVAAWSNKGNALSNLGRPQEAITYYDKALEINPRYAEAWNNKGVAVSQLGRYQEAIACYDKALEINPRDAKAWNNKGNALSNLGRHQEAVVCYDKALEINPRLVGAWNNKGFALDVLGRHQEAITCFDKALEINPRLAEAWSNKGLTLVKLGRIQEAVVCCDKALEINLRYAEAWSNKGTALGNLGRFQEAIACFAEALEINPRYADAWYNKGTMLSNLGRPPEAVVCFDKALGINPRLAEAWYNKGNALGMLGRHQEAVVCFDKALEINPRDAEAWSNKGLALVNLGRFQEAISSLQIFIELAPPQDASQVRQAEEMIRKLKQIF